VDADLDSLSATLANIVRDELTEQPEPKAAAAEARRTLSISTRAIAILDADGRELASSWNGLTLDRALPSARAGRQVWTTRTAAGDWRVHAGPETFGATTLVLMAARPLAEARREQRAVREALLVGMPIALLLAGAGGLWLASVGLRPISEMAQQAASIAPTGMSGLGHSDRPDELGQLARAFNGLVARLRAAL